MVAQKDHCSENSLAVQMVALLVLWWETCLVALTDICSVDLLVVQKVDMLAVKMDQQ